MIALCLMPVSVLHESGGKIAAIINCQCNLNNPVKSSLSNLNMSPDKVASGIYNSNNIWFWNPTDASLTGQDKALLARCGVINLTSNSSVTGSKSSIIPTQRCSS